MTASQDPHLWSLVTASAGLEIPPQNRESFETLADETQSLMGTLRNADLGETPPAFSFYA